MEGLIVQLGNASTTVQAIGVSVGGLIGVFATLAVFFVISWVAIRFGNRR